MIPKHETTIHKDEYKILPHEDGQHGDGEQASLLKFPVWSAKWDQKEHSRVIANISLPHNFH